MLSAPLWGLAALVKANPLYMLVLPATQFKWRLILIILAVFIGGLLLPDLLRPGGSVNDNNVASVSVPRVIIEREGGDNTWEFALKPLTDESFAYLREYAGITAADTGPKWWQDAGNRLNQSVTIVAMRLLPANDTVAMMVFLFWCVFFAGLVFWQSKRGRDVFELGLLCYGSFRHDRSNGVQAAFYCLLRSVDDGLGQCRGYASGTAATPIAGVACFGCVVRLQ